MSIVHGGPAAAQHRGARAFPRRQASCVRSRKRTLVAPPSQGRGLPQPVCQHTLQPSLLMARCRFNVPAVWVIIMPFVVAAMHACAIAGSRAAMSMSASARTMLIICCQQLACQSAYYDNF